MLENILLAIVLPLVKAGIYFVGYSLAISECWRIFWRTIFMALVNAGEYFVGYCPAFGKAGEYFVGYCLAISQC